MGAAAMAILFGGYTLTYWGAALLRGKNVSLLQLVNPAGKHIAWRKLPEAGNTVVFPDGTAASEVSASTATSTGGGGGAPAGPAGGIENTRAISAAAARQSWQTGPNWDALTHLVSRESGGDPRARNPSSGAHGIAQALGHGVGNTAGSLGNEYGPINGDWLGMSPGEMRAANSGDAHWQSMWMMGYIRKRYGSPLQAWRHEQTAGWY